MADDLPQHDFFKLPPFEAGLYQHFKGGTYNALGLCTHSETGEVMVLYISLASGNVMVRPLENWHDVVEVADTRVYDNYGNTWVPPKHLRKRFVPLAEAPNCDTTPRPCETKG